MHLPDGLIAPYLIVAGWLIAIIVLAVATYSVNKRIDSTQIPLMAVLAGGIFVAQMINFPIGGGVSSHLVGGVLAVQFVGLYAGIIVMTVILIIQALLFGDGGITALGLNILNLAVITCFAAFFITKIFAQKYSKTGIFIAAWVSIFLASIACAFELGLSYLITNGTYGIHHFISFPILLGFNAIAGIGEGIITVSIISFISVVSPDMLKMRKNVITDA
jgi:cobalt/nickel transport system permease protein